MIKKTQNSWAGACRISAWHNCIREQHSVDFGLGIEISIGDPLAGIQILLFPNFARLLIIIFRRPIFVMRIERFTNTDEAVYFVRSFCFRADFFEEQLLEDCCPLWKQLKQNFLLFTIGSLSAKDTFLVKKTRLDMFLLTILAWCAGDAVTLNMSIYVLVNLNFISCRTFPHCSIHTFPGASNVKKLGKLSLSQNIVSEWPSCHCFRDCECIFSRKTKTTFES